MFMMRFSFDGCGVGAVEKISRPSVEIPGNAGHGEARAPTSGDARAPAEVF
jgi:hypothetical protein